MNITHGVAPSPGLSFTNQDAIMTLNTGLTCVRGDVLAVVMTTLDSSLRFATVRQALTADFNTASGAANAQAFMCVALEDQLTAAQNVRCRFVGEVDALIEDTGLAIGAKLTPTTASRALDTQAAAVGAGTRSVAVLLEATTAAGQVKRVAFDGLQGVVGGIMITNVGA